MMMMMMMVFTKWVMYDNQIKSLLIITLCTFFGFLEKKITKVSVFLLESWLVKYPLKWSYSTHIVLHLCLHYWNWWNRKSSDHNWSWSWTLSSPRKVSSSKSGSFSFSGKSSFSHGPLIGLLVVAIATVRICFFQRVAVLSYPSLKKRWSQNKCVFPSENGRETHTQNHKSI